MRIPAPIYREMVAHAMEEYPTECCGILAGKDSMAVRLFRLTNANQSPVTYLAEPREQLKAFVEMDEGSLELVAIYHSHPHSPPYPSATDVKLAFYPDAAYIIISLGERERIEARAFRIQEGKISEEALVVE